MLQPCVVLDEDEPGHPNTGHTRVVYDPEEDGFFVQQGEDVSGDPECPVQGSIFLTLQQLLTLNDIVFQSPNFANAMAMARQSYTGKHFH